MWWFNENSVYRFPQSQIQFNEPSDLYATSGKNDQKTYVSPRKRLVIIGMGNTANSENVAFI